MFYGTGGVAFVRAEWANTATATNGITASYAWGASKTLTGWVIGAGTEYMISRNWIARAEYLYEKFGSFTVPHDFSPQNGTLDIGGVHKLRVGVSYKFGP